MKISNPKKLLKKKLIVFDLDGTLAPTKSAMDREMDRLLNKLLTVKQVAVIGGGKYELFRMQLLAQLSAPPALLKNLFLFPVTSTSFYKFQARRWKKIYALELPLALRRKIKKTFYEVFRAVGYQSPKKIYGTLIEDRKTQVTFSALGQDVVAVLGKKGVAMKEQWLKENRAVKMKIAAEMTRRLPGLEVHAAGFTSMDVTRRGIDKAYGIRQIKKYLKVPIADMLFVGDAIFPGGNDYAALKSGVDYVAIKNPAETKQLIRRLLQ